MKKVKVIFPDGSTADIDESDLQAALNGGAKLYKAGTKKQVKFEDGSIADLDEEDANSALSAGATLVKKKDGTVVGSVGASLGGNNTTSTSNGQLGSPENNPLSFQGRNAKGNLLANFSNDPAWKKAPEPVKAVGQLAPKNPFALPDDISFSPEMLDSQEMEEFNAKKNSVPVPQLANKETDAQIVKEIIASRENDAVMRERAKKFIVSDAAKNNIPVDPDNLPNAEEYFKTRRDSILNEVETLQSELSDLGAKWGENLYQNPDAIKIRDRIQVLDNTFGEVRKYSNWAVKDQVKKIDPKDYANYSDYLKAVGMKVNSVDNYNGVKKKEEAVLNGSEDLRSKEIQDKENYNFELTGIEVLQSNIIKDFNEGKIDETTAKNEMGKLFVTNQTLENRYPEAAIDNLRKYLGDYIAQKRKDQDGNLKQTWHNVVSAAPSEQEIITAIHELRANDGVEITDDQEKALAAKPDKIPLTSMIGHLYKSTILKGAQTVNSMFGIDNEERKLEFRDPTMYQPVQPGEIAAPVEVGDKNIVRMQANPEAGKHADILSWATANSVSDVAGTIASFIGLNKVFGAVASKALGGVAGAETVGMTVNTLGELKPITALTAAQTNLAANILSATYLNYYDKLDYSKSLTDDPLSQKAYALSSSIITGLVFSEINPGKIFSGVAGAEEKAMGQKFIDKLLQGKGTLEPEKLKSFFAEWATNTAKDLGHNLTLVKANQIADIALDRLTNKNALANRDVMDEMFGSLPADVISFLPFSAVVGYKQAGANTGIRNAIRMALTDPVRFESDMLKNVETGKISPDDATQKINYVKGLLNVYRGNDLNTEKLLSLTPEQRFDYANNMLKENAIKHNISKMTDELQIAGEKDKITALQEERKSILESAETKIPDVVTPAAEATPTETVQPVSATTDNTAAVIPENKTGQNLAGIDTTNPDEITVGEMVDKIGTYKGERGNFFQDGQSLIFKVEGKNKEYELGNIDAIKNEPISSLDIVNEQSVVNVNDAGNIEVRGKEYANNFSDPLKAINYGPDGKVISVNLETADGKKRTFRGNIAEDIAYQINLKKITSDNETATKFEEYINSAEISESINQRLPEATPAIPNADNGQVQPIERIKVEPADTNEGEIIKLLEGRKQVPEFELAAIKANPKLALREIADQALGFGRDGKGNRMPLDESAPEPQLEAVERKYGKEFVQKAIEMFPAEEKPSTKNTAATSSNKGLTKEAQDLISGIGDGSMPTFITKNLEKIAADNGIEITDKMTAADVVNALKEKGDGQKNENADVKPISDRVKSKFDKLKNKSSETKSTTKQRKTVKAIEDKAADAENNNDAAAAAEVIKEIDDLINKTPEQQARDAGQKEVDGTVVKRQEPLTDVVVGKEVDILFTKDDKESGNYAVIERSELQPSHKSGIVNELHFIPEAQPRDRGGLEVLRNEAKNKSDKLDPNQLADNNIAYFGAPVVNERGEVIQGNGRAEAIDYYYANDKKDSRGYKEMLQEKATSLGLDAEAVSKMKEPVLVKMTKANDERAIELGNYSAGELEDVKQKGADVRAAFNRLTPAKVEELASTINSKIDETATLKQIIRDNVKVVLDKLFDLGALRKDNKEQYIKDGDVTPDGIQAAYDVVRKLLFEGGASDLEAKFDTLPFNTREAIEKTIPAILNNPELKAKVQEAIEIMRDQQESGTDSFATWRIQRDMFGDQKMPSEKYEKELLDFAQGMSEAKTQKPISERIIKLSKAMNETPADMFAEAIPAKRFDEAYNQPDIKFAISEKANTEVQQMKEIVRDIQNEYAEKDEPITLDEIKSIAKSELGPEYNEQLVEDAYNEAGKESRAFKKATAIKNELAKRIEQFTGSETTVLPDSEALIKKAEELKGTVIFMKSPTGEILGFTHEGKIYLNGERLNPNTPVHEAGHIWVEVAKEKMPAIYNRGRELVKGSTYLKKATENEFYQQEANKLPKDQRKAYFEHEALAAAIGDKGAQFITEARRKSFIDWAKDLWTRVAQAVGFKGITSREMENMTLDEFAKRAAGDILKGKEPVIEEEAPAPEPEPAKSTEPVAGDATLLSHAGMQDIANDFGLADVQSKNPETDIKIAEDAAATAKAWHEAGTYAENINRLITEIEKGSGSNPVEKIILQQHIANVREAAAKIENVFSKEYDEIITELDRLKRAGAKLKSTAGATLRDTTVFSDADPTMADWMAERKEVLEVDELTNGQKEEIQNIWNEYETNLKTADEKVSQAEQEIEKLKAELATKTERQKRSYLRNKNQAALKTERENIIKTIQEKLKKSRGETNLAAVPYAKELFAIAPDVSKLVTNLIDSGITKLADIVDNIHGTLVDAIPGITKRDVHNIIAGEYNDKRPTLTELQYAKKDVIEEARLINKLEKLQNGEPVGTERELRKRNKEITDLRNKIKEYRKYDQSARTPDQILNSIKKRNEARKKEIDEKIANKDFSTKPKPVPVDENKLLKQANPELWNETMDAINAKEESGNKFELLKKKDELAKRGPLKKYLVDPVGKLITTAKAIKAGIDDSVTMVQLMMAVYSNPRSGIKAKISAFQDINNTHFKRQLAALHNSVYWPVIEGSGLDITEPQSFGKKEVEELYSGNLLDDKFKIPFTDKKINPWTYTGGIFERIFTSMGNNLRLNLFYKRIAMLENQGKTFDSHPEEYKGAARAINELTGRGKVTDKLQTSMEAISPIIWAPKMLASTFNTLGITDVAAAFRGKKGVYREIPPQQARYLGAQMAKGIGMGVAVMTALAMRGWTIDKDPRSNTFGNVTSPDGNRKYNVFGRFGSLVKNLVQLVGGTKVSSTGQEIDIDKSMGGRGKSLWTFVRGKMTPASGIFADYWLNNKTNTFTKQPINLGSLRKDLIDPISFSALSQGLNNDGTMGLLNRFLPEFEGIQVTDKRDYKTISTSLPDRTNKFLEEHNIPQPYFNPKQIEIKQMKGGEGSIKKLSDFDEETQVKYEKTHSQVFDQELSKLKNSFVFKDAYGNISLHSDDAKDKKVWVKKLDEKEMKKFISIINAKATEKTKQLLFKEYQK